MPGVEPSSQDLKLTGNFQTSTLKYGHTVSCDISPIHFGVLTGVVIV